MRTRNVGYLALLVVEAGLLLGTAWHLLVGLMLIALIMLTMVLFFHGIDRRIKNPIVEQIRHPPVVEQHPDHYVSHAQALENLRALGLSPDVVNAFQPPARTSRSETMTDRQLWEIVQMSSIIHAGPTPVGEPKPTMVLGFGPFDPHR